ncbi:MAG: hypothetical protein ABL956_18685 [Hyphomonadaceae bacterium]
MIVLDASAALEFADRRQGRCAYISAGGSASCAASRRCRGDPSYSPNGWGRTLNRVCEAALQDWLDTPVQGYPHDTLLNRVGELRANFSGYAAAYIALAEQLNAPLVRHDRKMAPGGHRARIEIV